MQCKYKAQSTYTVCYLLDGAHTQTEMVAIAFNSAFSSEDRGAEARVYFGPVLDDEGRTGRLLRTSSMSPQDQHDEPSKTTTTVATTKATTTPPTGAPADSLRFLPPFSPPGWLWLCLALSFCSALSGSVSLRSLSCLSLIRSDALPYPLPGSWGKSLGWELFNNILVYAVLRDPPQPSILFTSQNIGVGVVVPF